MTQITVRPTQGFTTPPKGMEFTATIRETKRGGIHGKSNYGATAEQAKANLMARLESEGHQFEDADGNEVTQYVNADGFLQDVPAADSRQCDCGHRDWQHLRHNMCDTCECYRFTNEAIRRHEYEPNFNGFISTVTGKEIATVGLVVLMFVSIWFAV